MKVKTAATLKEEGREYDDADARILLGEIVRYFVAYGDEASPPNEMTVQELAADLIDSTKLAEYTNGLDVFGFDYEIQGVETQ